MMNVRKIILVVCVFSLGAVLSAFSQQSKSELANKAMGEVEISADNGESAWAEFRVSDATSQSSASGFFHYWLDDKSKESYVEMAYVKVDGEYAWFAGKCSKSSENLTGRWFFAAVHDGGMPGNLVDHIWWDWLADTPNAESIAKEKVENMERPTANKPIESGDVTVRFYD